MSRREFSGKVKDAAYKRSGGRCEIGRVPMPNVGCGAPLFAGNTYYEHINPDGLTGDPTLENCAVLCRTCWRIKTTKYDQPEVARAKRRARSNAGIRPRTKFKGWRKFDGTPVRASDRRS